MKTPKLLTLIVLLLFLPVLSLPGQVCAQEDGVTFDQVNAIAEKLYCPVCPNETLEDCQTQACAQWRAEIAEQLAEGQTEQQVIDAFVRRYGERVVAIPQDPGLRALSVLTPYLLGGLALIVGTYTLLRWSRRSRVGTPAVSSPSGSTAPDDGYRARLERDLRK